MTMAAFTFRQDWENSDGMMCWDNDKTIDRYREICEARNRVDLKQFDCFFAFSPSSSSRG